MDPAAAGLAVGAVLSGLGSFLAAAASIRSSRRRARDDCDKRIREFEKALRLGMKVGSDRPDSDEWRRRWSHLY